MVILPMNISTAMSLQTHHSIMTWAVGSYKRGCGAKFVLHYTKHDRRIREILAHTFRYHFFPNGKQLSW